MIIFQKRHLNKNLLLAMGFMIVTLFIWGIVGIKFETNDDIGLMYLINGNHTGSPEIMPFVMSVPYTLLISIFYTIFPQIQWYIVFELFLLLISIGTIFLCITQDKISLFKVFASIVLYISICVYNIIRIQYTTVAAFCGAAAICLIISQKKSAFSNISMSLFIFFATGIRYQVGVIVVAMIVGFNGILYLHQRKNHFFQVALAILTALLVIAINQIYVTQTDWKEFSENQAQRALWKDYEHLPYEGNEKIYESIGWDADIYRLASSWCFLEENITFDAFQKINESYKYYDKDHVAISDKIIVVYQRVKENYFCGAAILFCLVGCILLTVSQANEHSIRYLCWFCLISFILLIITFSLIGRMDKRLYHMSAIMTLPPLFMFLANGYNETLSRYLRLLSVGSMCILMISGLREINAIEDYDYEAGDKMYQLAIDNPENIYIYDLSMSSSMPNPLTVYKTRPTNIYFWGGWNMGSPLYAKWITCNGLEHLYLSDMLEKGMYYIGTESYANVLLEYYKNRYENVKFTMTEKEYFSVYWFRIEESSE